MKQTQLPMEAKQVRSLQDCCIRVLSRSIGRTTFSETGAERSDFLETLVCKLAKEYLNGIQKLHDRILCYYKLDRYVKSSLQRRVPIKEFILDYMKVQRKEVYYLDYSNLLEHQTELFRTLRYQFCNCDIFGCNECVFNYAQLNALAELLNTDKNNVKNEKRKTRKEKKAAIEPIKPLKSSGLKIDIDTALALDMEAFRKTIIPDTEYSLDAFIVPSRKKKRSK